MLEFLSGLVVMGYVIAGLFFLKFWSRTRDLLFGAFSAAFALLALEQAIIAVHGQREELAPLYLVRLLAFILVIGAILWKNRSRT
jgi:hypothetical protein